MPLCLIHPLKTLFVRCRKAGACLIAVGFFGAALALFWPASTTTVSEPKSLLGGAMPQYEFVGHHQIPVQATPANPAEHSSSVVTSPPNAGLPCLRKGD